MPAQLVSQTEFHQRARASRAGGTSVFSPEARVLRTVDDGKRIIRWVFSDGSVDRAGDTIDAQGWQIAGFRRNPVVLFAHDALAPPIGRASNVRSDGARLLGDIEFADASAYEFADTIYKLVRGGFIKAGSVGFLPIEWDWSKDKSRPYGIDFKRQELLEFSIVPVPCNAGALSEASAKGIDTRPLSRWAERVLDEHRRIGLPRSAITNLRTQAKPPASRDPGRLERIRQAHSAKARLRRDPEPAPAEAKIRTLEYVGTAEQRQWQAEQDYAHSPEAHRARVARLRRLQSE